MVEANARSILVGENPESSIRFLRAPAATLLIGTLCALVGHLVSEVDGILIAVGFGAAILVPVFGLFSITQAYRNQGLVVNWLLLFAPLFVAISSGFGVGLFTKPTLVEWFQMGITQGGGYALLVGTVTFAIGFIGRLLTDWKSEQT